MVSCDKSLKFKKFKFKIRIFPTIQVPQEHIFQPAESLIILGGVWLVQSKKSFIILQNFAVVRTSASPLSSNAIATDVLKTWVANFT
jgi:hypothetical protein